MIADSDVIERNYVVNLGGTAIIVGVILVLAIVIFISAIIWLFTRSIVRAQEFPPRNALITSLAMLTFIALIASLFTRNAALETIAATGVGAIAGALSNLFVRKDLEISTDEREPLPVARDPKVEEIVPISPDPEE